MVTTADAACNGSQFSVNKQGKVYLELPGEYFAGRRCIGWMERGSFHTRRNPEQHLMRTLNAYGFNHDFILRGGFEEVLVHTPTGMLKTSRRAILDYGKILFFKKRGFERQIFLRIEDFGKAPRGRVVGTQQVRTQLGLFGTTT